MDKYDEAVKYLTDNPSQIGMAWFYTFEREGGQLFKCQSNSNINCPTMFKRHSLPCSEEEAVLIKQLPHCLFDIKVSHLPIFADLQRVWDKLYRNKLEDNQNG